MIVVLAILLMAVPAMAQKVTVSATSEEIEGDTYVTISYDCNGAPDPCEIRAFALDIILDANGVIAEAWSDSEDYWVFPGTYDDDWSVVAPNDDPGALEGIGSAEMTTEQGSLYAISEGDTPPVDACDLLTFRVSGDGTVCVSISANGTRAGVVSKDNPGTPPDITFKGTCFDVTSDPIIGTCWDITECGGQPSGDADCDGLVGFPDLGLLKASFFASPGSPNYNCCADFDQDCLVGFPDLGILKSNFFQNFAPATNNTTCPDPVPCP